MNSFHFRRGWKYYASCPLHTILFTSLTCAQRTRVHFCPQHWLLCHLGLYLFEFECQYRQEVSDRTTGRRGDGTREWVLALWLEKGPFLSPPPPEEGSAIPVHRAPNGQLQGGISLFLSPPGRWDQYGNVYYPPPDQVGG
jgi:hypothetical protein